MPFQATLWHASLATLFCSLTLFPAIHDASGPDRPLAWIQPARSFPSLCQVDDLRGAVLAVSPDTKAGRIGFKVAYGLNEEQMLRWGLYVSKPLGPDESSSLFSGELWVGGLWFGAIDDQISVPGALPTPPVPCSFQGLLMCHPEHTPAPDNAPVPPSPLEHNRAGPVSHQPGGSAACRHLLQRQLRPPRPEADRAGWVWQRGPRDCVA